MTRNRSSKWWSPALTLTERAITRRADIADKPFPPATTRGDVQADRRLDRWRRQRPFDRPELLARRLELDALSETDFASLLATPVEAFAPDSAAPPRWVAAVEETNAI